MIIRKLIKDDLPFLLEIRNECYLFLHDPRTFTLEECIEWFESTNPKYYILEYLGERLGYFRTSCWTQNSVYIGLDIHKNYRGKGYAVSAYELFMDILEKEVYYLRVLTSNKRALHIYKKLGFEIIGSDKDSLDMRLCR